MEIIAQQSWKKAPDAMWSIPLALWRADPIMITAGRFLSLLVCRLDVSSAGSSLGTVSAYKETSQSLNYKAVSRN